MWFNNTNPNNSSDLLAVLASRRPKSAEKHTTVSQKDSTHRELWGKLRSKGQNVWTLFVTIIFSKPEDAWGENQRSVGWVRVRHPGSLQVLLISPRGGSTPWPKWEVLVTGILAGCRGEFKFSVAQKNIFLLFLCDAPSWVCLSYD